MRFVLMVGRSNPPQTSLPITEPYQGVGGKPLLFILLVAFLCRAGFAVYWHERNLAQDRLFALGDSDSYWTLAGQIAQGKDYQYGSENARIFRAPVLPILLSPFAAIAGEDSPENRQRTANCILAARFLLCGFGTAAVWLVAVLGARLGGSCAGYAAGSMAAVYPSAIGMSANILSEAVFLPLMCLHIFFWQFAWRRETHNTRYALLAGLCAGLAVLTRPSWLLFIPFLCAIGLIFGPRRWLHLRIGVLTLLAFCVTMSPWWIRNASITGRFVPTTLQVGPSLYDGLNPNANGASAQGMGFMQRFYEEQIAEDRQTSDPESTLEFRLNQRANRAAIRWASNHPAEVASLGWAKFKRTWSLWPDGGDVGSPAIRLGITLGCFGTLLLAVVGTLLALRPVRWEIAVCFVPCIYFTLLHMVFVGSIRYREPAVFLLCIVAGSGLAFLCGCRVSPTCRPEKVHSSSS